MKTSIACIKFLLCCFIFLKCSSGNKFSEQPATDIEKLLKKFEKDSHNENTLSQIHEVYNQTSQRRLTDIKALEINPTTPNIEAALNSYKNLQQLYVQIHEITGLSEKIQPQNYAAQIDSVRQILSIQLSEEADFLLKQGYKMSCRQSYYTLLKLKNYQTEKSRIDYKIHQALKCGSINILINEPEIDSKINHVNLELNNFNQKIIFGLKQNTLSPFVKIDDQNTDPDETVFIYFKNFSVGVITKENTSRDVTANSALPVGRRSRVSPVAVPSGATITSSHITSTSSALIRIEILTNDGNVIEKEEFNSMYEWVNETNTYSGDSRSLSATDRVLLRNQVKSPPSDNVITADLLKQLTDQVINFLQTRYAGL